MIDHAGVAAHPGDLGMERIAECILSVLAGDELKKL